MSSKFQKFKFKGEIIEIGDLQEYGDRFKFKELILTELIKDKPSYVKFKVANNQLESIKDFKKGDVVEFEFMIQGKRKPYGNDFRYWQDLLVYNAKMVKELKKNLFNTADVSLPDANDLASMDNEIDEEF